MAAIPALASQTGVASLRAFSGKVGVDLGAAPGSKPALDPKAKARASSTDFEAVFLSSMFNQMLAGVDGEGPLGGSGGAGVWRSFLSDEYAKTFAKAGGIGIADHVYRSLIAQQEASIR